MKESFFIFLFFVIVSITANATPYRSSLENMSVEKQFPPEDSITVSLVNNTYNETITFSWITHEPNSVPGTPIYYGQVVLAPGEHFGGKIHADPHDNDITVSTSNGAFTFSDQNGNGSSLPVTSKTFTTNLYNYYTIYFSQY